MERILVIDDDESIRETLFLYLSELDYSVSLAEDGEKGYELYKKEQPDIVVSDIKMPGMSGLELLKKIKKEDNSNVPVIIITAFEDMQSTIEAMQLGAYDYIEKPLEAELFKVIIKRALETQKLSERLSVTISETSSEYQIKNSLVGKTQSIKEIYKKIGQVSANRVTVLIQGESGTGKELISKIIHYSGVTKNHPFVAVNCTALTETLLESELFGHVTGAFTGAIREKKGKFELAGEGTIFLDEISEISQDLQVKLLRVLQEKEFEKVGGEKTIPVKARIIAATNKNLSELVNEGKFRKDLYYRLKVFNIEVPPLRERNEDIPYLVVHLLKKINKDLHKNVRKIPYDVMEKIQEYEWVGNVRELENTLMQAVVLSKGDVLEEDTLMMLDNKKHNNKNDESIPDFSNLSLEDMEKYHISKVLKKTNGDKQKACKILGITKPTLYSKIKKYDIEGNGKIS